MLVLERDVVVGDFGLLANVVALGGLTLVVAG
jgi:hypothetical protein